MAKNHVFAKRMLGAFAAAAATAASAAAEIPIEDFARHAAFREVKISPDGDYLAASAVVDDQTVLSLIKLDGGKGVNVRPRQDGEVAELWWVAPHRVIYTVAERFTTLESPAMTGELYGIDADGKGQRLLIGFRVKGEWISADVVRPVRAEDGDVLIAKYRWNGSHDGVYPVAAKMDVDSGRTIDLTTAPIRNASFLADNAGNIRFAFAEGTDQNQRVYYRPADGGDWTLVFDQSKGDASLTPLAFDRGDGAVWLDCDGTRRVGGLCKWDVATRKLSTVWSGSEAGLESLLPAFDGKGVYALRSMPGRAATTLIHKDAPESKLLVALMAEFPGEDVRITSATADGGKAVFVVESGRNPGQFYLYDAKARKATFLFARMPWIDPERMAKVEPIALDARDGLALHGYLTRPPGKESARDLPLVVFAHGGPYGIRDRWEFDPHVQLLASRGYEVLQVNYRGSGGYGQRFVQAGFREWGRKMQDDVTDATKWAVAEHIADPKRICIFGGSYGGYAALEGAVREPDLYRCTIGYVGVYDLRLMKTRGDIPQSLYGENYLSKVLGDDESVLWDRSPIAHIDRLKARVLLAVGGEDKRVPPIQGEHLHNALDRAHIAHEWIYERNEGHGFYDEGHRANLMRRIVAFLDRNIGSSAPADAGR